MIELLKSEYWSKSDAFLLPLTGLSRTQKYKLESYLFWEKYSIEDYYLTIRFTYDNYDEFLVYCKKMIFPVLNRYGYLVETYDYGNQTVMVLNIADWAMDIEMFLKGKYSKFSKDAKDSIYEYHTYFDRGPTILIGIKASLYPNTKSDVLGMTPIEYVAENYELSLEELKKIGEVGGIYNKDKETLKGLPEENDHYLQKEGSSLE